ncbi:MAG: NADH pyrophosphatase [Candidatus Dactylopiibacterium carminicum]|nr:MAG: NADH pyrophosphatase [Candidatus Dactylopiibacterium carminicum]
MHAPWPAGFLPDLVSASIPSTTLHFAFWGDDLLIDATEGIAQATALATMPPAQALIGIGRFDGDSVSAQRWPVSQPLPGGLRAVSLRQLFGSLPEGHWELAARAKQLLDWDLASRFCGSCGHINELADGEPAKHCPHCGRLEYPRIAPAIMCLVRRGRELLLARSKHFRPGMYSALAGFVESGESVEDCVHREVFEETGLHIRDLRWFASQPWPFPHSLMLAFHAEYAAGEITPQASEIEDAQWFSLDDLPELPAPVSIASRLIQAGIAELQKTKIM